MTETSADPSPQVAFTPRRPGFDLARQWRLIRKELAETLRDRRTIVTLVLMPLLVYPLLSMVFRQFLASSLSPGNSSIVVLCVENDEERRKLESLLQHGNELLERQRAEPEHALSSVEPPLVLEPEWQNIRVGVGDGEFMLRQGSVDLLAREIEATPLHAAWQLTYRQDSPLGTSLRSYVERRLRAVNEAVRNATAEKKSIDAISLHYETIANNAPSRSLLPAIVPLILLMMTITGAVYPAIDLTAGERERGTLEALIAAPVSRVGVLMAKYVAVLTVAMLTATINLLSMSITIYSAGLASLVVGQEQSFPLLGVEVFGLLLLFASFFSAVLLAVTSFARSFKEAQAYLIPLMLVTLAPGLLSLSPSLELAPLVAFVPLVNVVLLARDVFAGTAQLGTALMVVVSTVLYAAVSISVAASLFGSDAILYGSGGSWSDLVRRPAEAKSTPGITAAMLCLAFVFAGITQLGGTAGILASASGPTAVIVTSAAIMVVVFVGFPLIGMYAERVGVLPGFRIQAPPIISWLAAVLLGASLGILVMELMAAMHQSGFVTISPALEKLIQEKAAELNSIPLPLILITLSIVPAVAEELFFRGYLLRSIEHRTPMVGATLITSLAFALFHIVGGTGIMIERFLPSLLLGIALGTLAVRSGSVLPGMVLHTINNGLLLLVARNRDILILQGYLRASSEHLPAMWLIGAAAAAMIGLALLYWSRSELHSDPVRASATA